MTVNTGEHGAPLLAGLLGMLDVLGYEPYSEHVRFCAIDAEMVLLLLFLLLLRSYVTH